MNKYLMLVEKALDMKAYINRMIIEGKRKGYIFKTYKMGVNEFEAVDGLIIETQIVNDEFRIFIITYHLDGEEIVQNSNCGCINITNKTFDVGGVTDYFDNCDVKDVYLCSTNELIKDKIIKFDSIENAIMIKAFVNDYKRNYRQYLETNHWQRMRNMKLKEVGYKCQLCGKVDEILHVHHNTYERIGNEDMNDLIVLCKHCHMKFHDEDLK